MYANYRPIGSAMIISSHDQIKGFGLFMLEPSGTLYEYYGCASGRGKQLARNEIEKTKFLEITVAEAVPIIAKILLKSQEEMKEKKQELEISIISEETKFLHKVLDREYVARLTTQAQQDIENEQMVE